MREREGENERMREGRGKEGRLKEGREGRRKEGREERGGKRTPMDMGWLRACSLCFSSARRQSRY